MYHTDVNNSHTELNATIFALSVCDWLNIGQFVVSVVVVVVWLCNGFRHSFKPPQKCMIRNVIIGYEDMTNIRCATFHLDKIAMRVNCVMFLRIPLCFSFRIYTHTHTWYRDIYIPVYWTWIALQLDRNSNGMSQIELRIATSVCTMRTSKWKGKKINIRKCHTQKNERSDTYTYL